MIFFSEVLLLASLGRTRRADVVSQCASLSAGKILRLRDRELRHDKSWVAFGLRALNNVGYWRT